MWRANAGQSPRHDLSAFGDKLREQTNVFVIDSFDLLDAELANLLAPEILAATATFASAAGDPGHQVEKTDVVRRSLSVGTIAARR